MLIRPPFCRSVLQSSGLRTTATSLRVEKRGGGGGGVRADPNVYRGLLMDNILDRSFGAGIIKNKDVSLPKWLPGG